ncbi:restriction endonuclease subunit S [uncultured Vibrio sp.]|uniref:restriction endonuclease subunit S n=1 Tax=uncultured Vibrio sp. TaxID=114054 RepID=UPI00261EAE02|nr:restriction endonuclease subunit S [uncultured Vibrio sp.]
MGKYHAYPDYKESGSKWLDSIPSHWEVTLLKHVLSTPITDGPHSTPVFLDEGIPFVSAEAVSGGYIDFGKIRGFISKEDDAFFSQKYSPQKHDVYMIKSGATTGITAIVETDKHFNIWSPLAVMRCKSSYNPYFLLNSLRSDYFQKSVQLSWTFGTQQNIGMGTLENLSVCYPPLEEQVQIANFLDHETAKIDALIDKQQQLIKLLKEKRQAVISHAVTKGLNPQTPMKDSGVEWLGEVPEHWDVCLFKYKCSEVTDGAHISPETNGGEHYFVSIRDIKDGVINFDGALLTSPSSYQYLVKTGCMPFEGDVLFSKDGTIGQTAITPSQIDFVVASSLIIIRPDRAKVTPEFLDFILQSSLVKEQVESFVKGAALRRLSIQNLLKVFGVFPQIDEQIEIVEYVQSKLVKFQELEIQANKQVSLLRERRTALISAAVTGKIDVRDFDGVSNDTK